MKLRRVWLKEEVHVPGAAQEVKKFFASSQGFDITQEGPWIVIAKDASETLVSIANCIDAEREAKAAKK